MGDDSTRVTRGGSAVRTLVAWTAIAGLFALVVWLASERNARTWHLVVDEGRLVVMRGVLAPVGRRAFQTSDPVLVQAYAPLVPPPGAALALERTFDEQSLLDQALYALLAEWARADIGSGDPARLERGLGYLARAEKLAGISSVQRDDLAQLRADSAFFEAERLLERAADELREAADKLRLAGGSRSPHATDAQVLLRDVAPAAEAAVSALRARRDRPRPPPPQQDAQQPPPTADSAR